MKLKTGKELNLTIKECVEIMRGRVGWFRVAGQEIYENGYYRVGQPYSRGGKSTVYYMNEDGYIETLCYNTTRHRSSVLIDSLLDGTINLVEDEIVQNYATNGYNTRRGLFRSSKNLARIKKIAKSHIDYIGHETGSSKQDHDNRVFLRN